MKDAIVLGISYLPAFRRLTVEYPHRVLIEPLQTGVAERIPVALEILAQLLVILRAAFWATYTVDIEL